jgi:hypothetical protein
LSPSNRIVGLGDCLRSNEHTGRARLQGHDLAGGSVDGTVALVSDPANRSALADLIMVQHGIAPNDPFARALISAAGADPEVVLQPG